MIPTRLQGTLTTSLLQWLRSCQDDELKFVGVRIVDGANIDDIVRSLQALGMIVTKRTLSVVHGRISAAALRQCMYLPNISLITELD